MWFILHYYLALILTMYQVAYWITTAWRFKAIPAWFDHYFKIGCVVLSILILSYLYQGFRQSIWNNTGSARHQRALIYTNLTVILITLILFYFIQLNSVVMLLLLLTAIILYGIVLGIYIVLLSILHQHLARKKI